MRRVILAALFLLVLGGAAQAACPAVLTDCPTINANTGNFGGAVSLNNWTTQNVTVLDPPIEARVNNWIITTNLTTGTTDNVTLPIVSQLNLNPGIYNYGTGGMVGSGAQHNVAFYGYGRGANTLPLAGCTPGVSCPGTIRNAAGVMGFAEQHGTGEQYNAISFESHSPNTPPAGGWLDNWWAFYDDGCFSGVNASMCTGIQVGGTSRTMYSGFGATAPMAGVHSRGGNKTATATGVINGTTLCLTSVPTNEISPGTSVTGTGVSAGTDITTTAPMSATAHLCYTVDVSQTVAETTLTFAGNYVPFIAQNFTAGTNSRYGFIIGGGYAMNAAIDGRNDATRPLGPFLAFNVNNLDQAYVIPFGGARAGGMAIGYQNITTLPVQYSLTVGTAGLNVDGKYFTSGTQGATCSGPGVAFASLNGLVTGCPPPVSGVVPQQAIYTTTTAGVAFPAGTSYARIIVQGQGGCGGGGGGLTTPFTGAGGAAGGGSSPKDTGWFPLSQVSGNYTVTIGTPCTAAPGGAAGGNGTSGTVGANAQFAVTGIPTIVSYGGGGGAGAIGGAGNTATGGGGGSGTIAVGGSSTTATGGGGGSINGAAGGSGVAAGAATGFLGGSGGGGSSATGAPGSGGQSVGGSTGGGAGAGCNAGVEAVGGGANIPLSAATTFGGGNAGGTTGVVGGVGPAAIGFTGAGGGGGGGSGTVSTGPGASGGAGGGGGGGGASGCAAGVPGAAGGVGGAAQVIVMTL